MSGLTIDDPISFTRALASGRVIPGDTLLLRGGTYSGDFAASLHGTEAQRITIQPYPNEHVILDGSLAVNGKYTDWRNLEITCSNWTGRDTVPIDANPGRAVGLNGTGNRFIGCIIHDTAGNGSWQDNAGGGFYECLIYNCGYLSPDRGHGHAIYTQNINPMQEHHRNIMWGQYGFGLHGYTATKGQLNGFDWRNNISFRNGLRQLGLGGMGGQRATGCIVDGNCLLEGDGYLKGTDVTLTNNYSPGGFEIEPTSVNVTQVGNTFTAQTDTKVFIFPTAKGAHVAVYNPQGLDFIETALPAGKLHNAQDYFTDIVTGTLPANQTVAVDMRVASHTVAARVGSTAAETTFPAFGCFVVEK